MSYGLDTSVIVRLLVGEPVDQAEIARTFLEAHSAHEEDPIHISDLVVGEAYFALRYHYRVPSSETARALLILLSDLRIVSTAEAKEVLAQVAGGQDRPGLMDRLIHAGYRRESAVFVTFDREASRLENAHLLTE